MKTDDFTLISLFNLYFSFWVRHQTKQCLTVLLRFPVYFLLLEAFKKAHQAKPATPIAVNHSLVILLINELSSATFVMKNLNTTTFFGYIIESTSPRNNAYCVPFVHLLPRQVTNMVVVMEVAYLY